MENNYDFNAPKVDLPNATIVLVLGIISILCCCTSLVGLICGIIALVLAKSATDLYVSNLGKYTESSYKNLNTGKTCAWIGLILSILGLISSIVMWTIYGFAALSDPNEFLNRIGVQ